MIQVKPCSIPALALIALLCLPFSSARAQLDFSLNDLSGSPRQFSEFGDAWVVVNFWATWCSPCLEEMPELQNFFDRFRGEGVQVLGISFENTPPEEIRKFVDKLGVTYPIWQIGDAPLLPFEPLLGLPTTFLVSPEGEVTWRHVGPVTAEQLEAQLRR